MFSYKLFTLFIHRFTQMNTDYIKSVKIGANLWIVFYSAGLTTMTFAWRITLSLSLYPLR